MNDSGFQQPTIDRSSVVTQVYEQLRTAILRGQFKAGERLVETQLAGILGVSRTPIREALSGLEVQGLVNRLPTGGVAVGDVVSEIVEIYGLRQRLEGFAASLAAERATDEELALIEAACERGFQAISGNSVSERGEADQAFHQSIAAATHSPRVLRLTNDYYEYALSDLTLRFYDRDTTQNLQLQHQKIATALRDHDPVKAEQFASEHVKSVLVIAQQALDAWKDSAPDEAEVNI